MLVFQPGQQPRLLGEAAADVRRQVRAAPHHFHGHFALQLLLPGTVHHAHAAVAQLAPDRVPGQLGRRGRAGGFLLHRLVGREERLELAEQPDAVAHLGQSVRPVAAQLFRREVHPGAPGGLPLQQQVGDAVRVGHANSSWQPEALPGITKVGPKIAQRRSL